jgi:hypothetical protein
VQRLGAGLQLVSRAAEATPAGEVVGAALSAPRKWKRTGCDEIRRLSDWYGSSSTNKWYQVEADDPQTRIASGFEATPD